MIAATGADLALVRRAIEVASGAVHAGDVPIGAVLVDADGVELAAACNAREATGDPTAHAELLVLRAGASRLRATGGGDGWRLTGCTLAVTVEPCTMCAGALVAARVDRLVFGAWEPKTGAVGSLWDVVRDRRLHHRPQVLGGVLESECAALLTGFFADHRTRIAPAGPVL
ncbi:MAG: tRNA(adenine34) deaminase [Pseudonocardiales bacterium]|jgi:tRNA(adenine34) deaminase|nr:tadA [Pseudonocardiales bacterium]MDT7715777.1 tRNA(adenine34) deaminase [Pseudonocardiales bacterium]